MTHLNISFLDASEAGFKEKLDAGLHVDAGLDLKIQEQVRKIITDVRQEGDPALLRYTQMFDQLDAGSVAELEVPKAQWSRVLNSVDYKARQALEFAAERIETYHLKQIQSSWQYHDDQGNLLGQQITPIENVGIYVPGGKASYPSSVLMNAIPAKVAGVSRVTMVVPAPKGQINPLVLAAAATVNVDQVFTLGGAQAIAALAYGTEFVAPVDKIVGPGNSYVAEAKRQVFGKVGIDMIAGPSEILVICDGKTDPDWIAMDLFSQAEHDEVAQAILISQDLAFIQEVERSMKRLLPQQGRASIIERSISDRSLFIKVRDIAQAVEWSNYVAPEHLELSVEAAETWLPSVRNAGAIFLGRHTPEAFGDYCAGPNHVLPTSGTARFSSALGVYDFQKRSSIINCSVQGADQLASSAAILARGEGLQAHAESAQYREYTRRE